jgi:farnesyl-diphosphate farnesyltransferase
VSLAYLFCRTADTLADTRLVPLQNRLQALALYREQFLLPFPALADLEELHATILPHQGGEGERQLLSHLSDCFQILATFSHNDQHYIRNLVLTLTRGMEMDLRSFPEETAIGMRALPDFPTLDLYTYYVAGVVGEFWTKIHVAHFPALRGCGCEALCRLGMHFGKGLQLTNILKDLAKDLQQGRCYLPQEQLAQLHVSVDAMRNPETLARIRPLIHRLIWRTVEYLDDGYEYIQRLPLRLYRLRLSCMWPLLFAVQTLVLVSVSDTLMQPHAQVKISRRVIYWTMFWSMWGAFVPAFFSRYYGRLRRQLIATLSGRESLAL